MKWLPLSIESLNEISDQITEVCELYKILFTNVKNEKQEELHFLLKEKIRGMESSTRLETQSSFNASILSEEDEHIVDYSRLDKSNTDWVNQVNKDKVLNSLHQAMENRLFQLEQFDMMNSEDEKSIQVADIRRKLALVLIDYPMKVIRKISELREALFYLDDKQQVTAAQSQNQDDLSSIEHSTDCGTPFCSSSLLETPRSAPPTSRSQTTSTNLDESSSKLLGMNESMPKKKVKPIYRWEVHPTRNSININNNDSNQHNISSISNNSNPNNNSHMNSSIHSHHHHHYHATNNDNHHRLSFEDRSLSPRRSATSPRLNRSLTPTRNPRHGINNNSNNSHNIHSHSNPELLMKLTPQEYEFLKDKRNRDMRQRNKESMASNIMSRSQSPRSLSPSMALRRQSSSNEIEIQSPRFLLKGGGRLASDGNAQTRIYQSTTGKLERSLLDISTLGEAEGLFITSKGPYQDPIYDPKPIDKSKWMSKDTFKTAGYIPEFYKDKNLPDFISSGIPYQSANPKLISAQFRPLQPEKFVTNQSFVTAVPSSGVSLLDKQYRMGAIPPNRATYHSRSSSPMKMSTSLSFCS